MNISTHVYSILYSFIRHTRLLLCLLYFSATSQNSLTDSLKQAFKAAKHDTIRCMALNDLGEVIFNQTPDSAFILWQQTVKIATDNIKTSSNKKMRFTFSVLLARAYLNYGFYYQAQKGPDDALNYFKKSLSISESINEKEGIANSLVDIGLIYSKTGDISQSLNYYHKALKIYEKTDLPNGLAFCLTNIGNLYMGQNDLTNALNYLDKALKIYESQQNNVGAALALNSISTIYNDKGDPYCKLSQSECIKQSKEKALKGFLKVLSLWSEENNQIGVAAVSLNIATVYKQQLDFVKAFDYAQQALKINEEVQYKYGIGSSSNMLADLMLQQGKMPDAINYANRSMQIAQELGYPKNLMAAASTLKQIYEQQNKYKEALKMHELYVAMRDSVNNETTRKTSIKKQFQIEYEKQVEKDSIIHATKIIEEEFKHQQAIAHQRTYTYGVVIGFILMLIVAIISFKAYKIKQKANTVITQQKQQIEIANKDLERQHLLNQKIFSVVSHDFRGPILSLNLVLNKYKNNSNDITLNNYLKDIGTSVHNANTVLNNLLNWAKAEIDLENFDGSGCLVNGIVTKIKGEFAEKLIEKKIEIIPQIPEGSMICLPLDILHITMRNLVSNAIKFSHSDNRIEVLFNNDTNTLIVKDFGIGIPAEKLPALFHQQVNAGIGTNKEEGFGIGLYIVSELLYKYNHTIKVESTINEGTCFTIMPVISKI